MSGRESLIMRWSPSASSSMFPVVDGPVLVGGRLLKEVWLNSRVRTGDGRSGIVASWPFVHPVSATDKPVVPGAKVSAVDMVGRPLSLFIPRPSLESLAPLSHGHETFLITAAGG